MYKVISAAVKTACVCLALAFCMSCTKAPDYPDLEGFWRQEYIEDRATGERTECNRLYWSLQLGLCKLSDLGDNGFSTYLCLFEYNEGAATLRLYNFIKGNTELKDSEVSGLMNYGVPSADETFTVVSLNSKHMTLQSDETILYFTAF